MVNNKIKVGMVGISFGMEFIPIYMKHPDVYEIAIADTNLELIKTAQEKFGIFHKSSEGRKTLWVYNPDGNEYSGVGRCH